MNDKYKSYYSMSETPPQPATLAPERTNASSTSDDIETPRNLRKQTSPHSEQCKMEHI